MEKMFTVSQEMCDARGYSMTKDEDLYLWYDKSKRVVLDFFPALKNIKLNSVALVGRYSLLAKNEMRHLIFVHGYE